MLKSNLDKNSSDYETKTKNVFVLGLFSGISHNLDFIKHTKVL